MIRLYKMKNRMLSLLVVLTLLAATVPSTAFAVSMPDIANHWAKVQIEDWLDKGLVKGYPDGTFKPDNSITRAEFITMVNAAAGYSQSASINFIDVKKADWFAGEIEKAKSAGYITGYTDGTMRPNNPISRQEAAMIILKAKELLPNGKTSGNFADASSFPEWSKGAIDAVFSAGFMSGYPDGSFKAEKFITRAEAVVALTKAYSNKDTSPINPVDDSAQAATQQNSTSETSGSDENDIHLISLRSIGNIIGTPQVGSVLTAGTLTPAAATVRYQWIISADGLAYDNITGARSKTYIPAAADADKFIKVKANGTGEYKGTVQSEATSAIKALINADTPIFTNNLTDTITNKGSQITLDATATVTDGGMISYEWFKATTEELTDAAAIDGETNPVYSPPVDVEGITYYYCIATNTNSTATGNKTASATSAVSRVTVKMPYEISWYLVGNGQPDDIAAVQEEANQYLLNKIGATITITCYDWDSYDENMKDMIDDNEPFDICFTSNGINSYRENVVKNAFLAINDPEGPAGDLLAQYAPNTKELLGTDFLSGSAINGKNYALPCNKEKGHNWGILFREDLVDKYSFDLNTIKKIEDLEPLLKTIKEKEIGIEVFGVTSEQSPYLLLDWNRISDNKLPAALYADNRDTKIINEFETPESQSMLNTLHRYYQAGYIRKDVATLSSDHIETVKEAGKVFAYCSSLKPGKDAEVTAKSNYRWVQVDITSPVMSNLEATDSMMAISATSADPVTAMKFLELLNSDKYFNNLINFGIEDRHYTKTGDETIEPISDSGYDEMLGIQWVIGNQFLNYLLPGENYQKWPKLLTYNEEAGENKLNNLGFYFDSERVKTQVAASQAIYMEFIPTLVTGTADPNTTLPKFINKLKAAGFDDIIEEMQMQFDQWLAEKE